MHPLLDDISLTPSPARDAGRRAAVTLSVSLAILAALLWAHGGRLAELHIGRVVGVPAPTLAPLRNAGPEAEAEAEAARAAAQRSLEQRMEQWAGPPPRPTEPDRDADGKVIKPLPLKVIEWENEMLRQGYGLRLTKTKGESTAFDVALNLLFPVILASSLLFLAFPFLAGNCIDVSTLPEPPTQ
eukprot:EG_transcript_23683